MKPHIGLISQWYDPEQGAAAVPGTIARSLLKRGHLVDVLTGFPNYPTGSLHPGYKLRPYKREQMSGVMVHRAPLYPSHDTHPVRRAANYLSFAFASTPVGITQWGNVDAVLVHSSPATAAIPAMALRAIRRKPYVVHVQDLWPQTVVSSGFLSERRSQQIEAALNRFCDAVYRRAFAVAVTSPGMADLIASRGVAESRISFVPNWTDEAAFRPAERNTELAHSLGIRTKYTVMYAGNFGEFQGVDTIIEAATLLRDRSDIGFALVGGGIEEQRLRSLVRERSLANVTFIEHQPFDRMADVLSLGDIQLISLKDMPLFRTTLPSKLQATLAAGRPIIAAVSGDAAQAVIASGAGAVVTPGHADQLSQAITSMLGRPELLQSFGAAGRAYYTATYSEAVVSTRLSELLTAAANDVQDER